MRSGIVWLFLFAFFGWFIVREILRATPKERAMQIGGLVLLFIVLSVPGTADTIIGLIFTILFIWLCIRELSHSSPKVRAIQIALTVLLFAGLIFLNISNRPANL